MTDNKANKKTSATDKDSHIEWKNFFTSGGVLRNLTMMGLLTLLLLFSIHIGMGLYTRHNHNVPIPNIQGKTLTEAIRLLEESSLQYEVVDSIYSKTEPSGTIYDLTPKSGHQVKPGRIIFLTIYTQSPRQKPIPSVEGQSPRSVIALLRSLGFESVDTKIVAMGKFDGECQGIELKNGKALKPGDLIPVNQPLVVLVKGNIIDTLNVNSLIDTVGSPDFATEHSATTDSTATSKNKPNKEPDSWW